MKKIVWIRKIAPAKFIHVPRGSICNLEDEKAEDDLVQEVYTYLTVKRYPDGVSEGNFTTTTYEEFGI